MARNAGYATEKRAVILEYLMNHCDEDVSVKDIEQYTNSKGISVNTTTIYRYLDKLIETGKVLKHVSEQDNRSTFQYVRDNHSCHNHLHMKCTGCGKIFHMDCGFMNEFQEHIFKHHQFILECKTSMLYGMCKSCSEAGV